MIRVSADFMISNNGTETLQINSLTIDDPDGAFTVSNQTSSIEPNEEVHF